MKDKQKTKGVMRAFLLALIVIMLIMLANYVVLGVFFEKMEDRGLSGDQFGGVTALFSGLAFAGLMATIWQQRTELSLQRVEMENSSRELALQRFDSVFFGLIRMLNDQVASISTNKRSGRPAMTSLISYVFRKYDNPHRAISVALHETNKDGVDGFSFKPAKDIEPIFRKFEYQLGPYFRILHNIYRHIDEEENLTVQQKRDYARMARAQLTIADLDMIFLNGITDPARRFKPYIEKYGVLKHTSLATRHRFREVNSLYDISAFSFVELPDVLPRGYEDYDDFKNTIDTAALSSSLKETGMRLRNSP